jgi:hypothetical protein
MLDLSSLSIEGKYDGLVAADTKNTHEVFFDNFASKLYLFALKTGKTVMESFPTWPKNMNAFNSVFTDTNGNTTSEVIFMDYVSGLLHVLSRFGDELAGWPKDLSALYNFDVEYVGVGYLDHPGKKEIVTNGTWFDDAASEACSESDTCYRYDFDYAGIRSFLFDGSTPRKEYETDETIEYKGLPVIGNFGGSYGARIIQNYVKEFETEDDYWNEGGIKIFTPTATGFTAIRRSISEKDSIPQFDPVIGEIDGNFDTKEILVVDDGYCDDDAYYVISCPDARIHMFRLNTTSEVAGWPVEVPGGVHAPPVIGDINGDNKAEIIINSDIGITAWNADGTRYMITNGVQKIITTKTVRYANDDYTITKINNPTTSAANTAVWFDRIETEEDYDYVYIFPGNIQLPASKAEFDAVIDNTLIPIQEFSGRYSGWSKSVPGNSIQIVLRADDPGVGEDSNFYGYIIKKVLNGTSRDFTETLNALIPSTSYFSGSPWLGDANNDKLLDLAAVAGDRIYVLNFNTPYRPEYLDWPMYAHDPGRTNTYTFPLPLSAEPPQLQFIGPRGMRENSLFQLSLKAFDPNGGVLTYRLESPLPSGANMTGNTFTMIPTATTPRSFNLRFAVLDTSGFNDIEDVTFTVEKDFPPDFPPIAPKTTNEGEKIEFSVPSSDQNLLDILTFSSSNLPSGALLSPQGLFSWTPTFLQSGNYNITVTVSDGVNLRSQPLSITVVDVAAIKAYGAAPNPFSPNNDGIGDSTTISASLISNLSWTVDIFRPSDLAILKTQSGVGTDIAITWTGKRSDGTSYPEGSYDYTIRAVDASGAVATRNGSIMLDLHTVYETKDIFSDNFEASASTWTPSFGSLWHVASNRSNSPMKSWAYNKVSEGSLNYSTGAPNSGSLTSAIIPIPPAAAAASLELYSIAFTEGGSFDVKKVSVIDASTNQETVLGTLPTVGSWQKSIYDLAPFLGKSVKIKFFFDTIDGSYNDTEGLYVDDVKIVTKMPVAQPPIEDLTPPKVIITGPADGMPITQGQSVNITADANDASEIAKVEFSQSGSLEVFSDDTAPYSYTWRTSTAVSAGQHAWFATAYDKAGNQKTSDPKYISIVEALIIPPASINVTAPTAGVTWYIGGQHSIVWAPSGATPSSFIVSYAPEAYPENNITIITTPNGFPQTYLWTISNNISPGAYIISICGVFVTGSICKDIPINIVLPFLNVQFPAVAGSIVNPSLPATIQWVSTAIAPNVRVDLMKKTTSGGYILHKTIFPSVNNINLPTKNTLSWTPGLSLSVADLSNTYRIYVIGTSLANTNVTGVGKDFKVSL